MLLFGKFLLLLGIQSRQAEQPLQRYRITRKRERKEWKAYGKLIRKSPKTTVLNSFKVNNNGRSSHWIMFYKKAVLKISVKFLACNFIKKETLPPLFPVNFAKFLRTGFLWNITRQLRYLNNINWCHSGLFIVTFEQVFTHNIYLINLVLLLITLLIACICLLGSL